MITRAFRAAGCRALVLSAVLALGMDGCTRVPLMAPTKSVITLYATAASVPTNGSIDLIATVIEEAGTPVQNGTLVSFTTTLGHLDPTSAHTTNGQATVKLVADGTSGIATVSAFSGGATAAPGEGTTGAAAATLTIPIGAGAADSIVVRAEPSGVPRTGGTVQIIAQVRDVTGNTIAGVPVTFTADAGQIQTATVITNASGEAQTGFTTTSKATVTARAGAKSATVVVDVAALPTVTLSASPTSPTAGQPVTFTINIDTSTGLNPLKSVRIAFGDGDFEDLSAQGGSTTVAHVYDSDGTRTVTVTVTDTANQQVSQVLVIVVLPKVPINVTLTLSPTTGIVNTTVVTFTASAVLTVGVNLESFDWDFGDGTSRTTTGGTTTKIYTATGVFRTKVTVHASDGSTGVGAADILIGP